VHTVDGNATPPAPEAHAGGEETGEQRASRFHDDSVLGERKVEKLLPAERLIFEEMQLHLPFWKEPGLKESDPKRYDEISANGTKAVLEVGMCFLTTLTGNTFVDLGSGAGQVVLHAGLLQPIYRFSKCIGLEIRKDLHDVAEKWKDTIYTVNPLYEPPSAAIEFHCDEEEGFLAERFNHYLAEADVLFAYNVRFHDTGNVNGQLGQLLPKVMKPGAVFLCAVPIGFDGDLMESCKIPTNKKPSENTTRHGATPLPLYAYKRRPAR
jgi:hypothetical protein